MKISGYHSVVPAAYVIVNDGSKILLRKRINVEYMDGYYSVPAGHVKPNETPQQCAVREAKEEVGIELKTADLGMMLVAVRPAEEGGYERVNFFFVTNKWHGEPYNCEPDRAGDVAWFERDALPANTEPQLLKALQNIQDGVHYMEFNYGNG